VAPFLTGADLADILQELAGLLMGAFGLPLAALLSAASAQADVPLPATADQPPG
jgi:hypothetical protein